MKKKIKILLVEDEEITRETLKAVLEEEEGYDILAVGSGSQAIEKAKETFFNIAMIDLKLPDINGLEVLRTLKNISPDSCAIIVTAYPSIKTTVEAIEGEAYDYVIKPYEISQIKFVIRRGLEKQKLITENKKLLSKLKIKEKKLEQVLQIGKTMSAILNLDELVNFIVQKVAELIAVEKVSLMLIDEKTGELIIKAAKGLDKDVINKTRVKIGETIAGVVFQQAKMLLVKDIEKDKRFKYKNSSQYKSKSFLSLPLKIKDKVTGVFNITDKMLGHNNVISDEDLNILSVIIHQAEISIENAKLYKAVSELAITDNVTGLFNHRHFQESLSQEINRVERYPHALSLLMIDIDDFKRFNDTYGHLYGDMVLKTIADILKRSNRKIDICCRYGGEEFSVILPETEIKGAMARAEKIKNLVEKFNFIKGKKEISACLTISIGVAEHEKGISREQLIEMADKALYQAKREGKNKICSFK